MNKIIESIREELQRNADEETRVSGQRFFKEETKTYGVKTATVTRLGKQYFKLIKDRKSRISIYARNSGNRVTWKILYRLQLVVLYPQQYQPDDFAVFRKWVDQYVTIGIL